MAKIAGVDINIDSINSTTDLPTGLPTKTETPTQDNTFTCIYIYKDQ